MGFIVDLDEYTLKQLEAEIRERERKAAAHVCTYCARDYWSVPACKFPRRHSGQEK